MVFRQKPTHAFKVRVTDEYGKTGIRSTGTKDPETARLLESMVTTLRRQHRYDALNLIVAKRLSLKRAYAAFERGTLHLLVVDVQTPNLDPLITEWGKHANEKYVKQVRTFIPKGVAFPASRFTRSFISHSLASLKVSGSTRNRYRAALSVVARWLVEREVIPHNPVRDVQASKPNPAREVYHEREDAQLLVASLPAPFNAIEALMANGLERQVIARLSRKDINLDRLTINARGSKTPHRNRVVRITEAWTVPIIAAHLKTLLPNAPVLTVKLDRVLDIHKRTCEAVKIQVTTLHDWRHTYAVNSLRDGMKVETVARQLGHRDANLVHKVYGRFAVDDRDYATTRATTQAAQQ